MANPLNQPEAPESPPSRRAGALAFLRRRTAWLAIGGAVVLVAAATLVVLANLPGDQDDPGIASEPTHPAGGEDPERVPGVLSVFELGATTPVPEGEWTWFSGPGDFSWGYSHGEEYRLGDNSWRSAFQAGVFDTAAYLDDPAAFDTADPRDLAAAATRDWGESLFSEATGLALSEIRYSEVEVDGYSAVLAEARHSWDSIPASGDTYEDTAMLLVDIDGINSFVAVASITETHSEHYDGAIEALLATSIELEAVRW